ncbi:hypothetical protein JXJ21_06735 [candidate division KSB1 bacterium]|nr:hypothetical protein [candidate division KSB1 bacterium]
MTYKIRQKSGKFKGNVGGWGWVSAALKICQLSAVENMPHLTERMSSFSWIKPGGLNHVKHVKYGTKRIFISAVFSKWI